MPYPNSAAHARSTWQNTVALHRVSPGCMMRHTTVTPPSSLTRARQSLGSEQGHPGIVGDRAGTPVGVYVAGHTAGQNRSRISASGMNSIPAPSASPTARDTGLAQREPRIRPRPDRYDCAVGLQP